MGPGYIYRTSGVHTGPKIYCLNTCNNTYVLPVISELRKGEREREKEGQREKEKERKREREREREKEKERDRKIKRAGLGIRSSVFRAKRSFFAQK